MNNIAIVIISRSVKKNCKILQNAVNKLFKWDINYHIKFDMNKIELIHFNHVNRLLNKSIKIINNSVKIKFKKVIKWLNI